MDVSGQTVKGDSTRVWELPPIRQQVYGEVSERLIHRFEAVISFGGNEFVRSGFSTESGAREWGELALCEMRAAWELRTLGAHEAAELCRGILTNG